MSVITSYPGLLRREDCSGDEENSGTKQGEGETEFGTEQEMTTAALVQKSLNGDREAWGVLYKKYYGLVFEIVIRRLGNRASAEEVTQDVFIQAFSKLGQLRDLSSFKSWICRIASNFSLNRVTRSSSRRENVSLEKFDYTVAASRLVELSPDSLIVKEKRKQVREAVDALSTCVKDTVIAFYFEDLSIRQISRVTSSPEGTVKRRLHEGRNRIRDFLGPDFQA